MNVSKGGHLFSLVESNGCSIDAIVRENFFELETLIGSICCTWVCFVVFGGNGRGGGMQGSAVL